MIYSLTGTLVHSEPSFAVVSCSGVAFKCYVTSNTLSQLPACGQEVTLLTHMNVKEDALDLYGFYGNQELELFRKLLGISGVGPKAALSILSTMTPDRFALAVAATDAKLISSAPGIGAKTAQRIVLELKDKLSNMDISGEIQQDGISSAAAVSASSNAADAVGVLVQLGYSKSEASLAVGKLDSSLPTDTLVKEALKKLF